MNIKRILATMLCFAMIMTSGVFTSAAYAEEIVEPEIILEETGAEEVTEVLEETAPTESSEKENAIEETAIEEPVEEISEEGEIDLITEETSEEETVEDLLIEGEENTDDIEITEEIELSEEDALALQATADVLEVVGGELSWIDPSNPNNFKDLGKTLYVPAECAVIPAEMFKGDAYLENINVTAVENTLVTIEEGAFEGCNKLSKFTASKALRDIGNRAFFGCTGLSTVGLSEVTTIGDSAFQNTGVIQVVASCCESVGANAFNGCTALQGVSLSRVKYIGESAFSGCIKLKTLGLPTYGGTLYYVGDFAFKNTALTTIDWAEYFFSPDTTQAGYLGTGVFSDCTALTYIYLPAVETIPASFLANCTALTTVIFNRNYEFDANYPIATKVVDSGAFSNCTALKTIDLALTYRVMTSAFSGDVNLTEAKFQYDGRWDSGEGLVIDNDAFPTLADPTKLTLKGYVKEVQNYADSRGYKFESLNELHKISLSGKYCTLTVDAKNLQARVDDLVTLKVKFTKDDEIPFILDELDMEGKDSHTKYHAWLTKSEKGEVEFQFYMPAEDLSIKGTAVNANKLKDVATLDRFSVEALVPEGYVPAGGNGKYTVDANGRQFKIQYFKPYNTTEDKNWQWIFTSNDTSVIRVDSLGYVTAIGAGSATVTATLKNTKITVPLVFKVEGNLLVKSVSILPTTPPRETVTYDAKNDLYVIMVNKTHVEKSALSFVLNIEARDQNGDAITVTPSYWSAVDSKTATVAAKTSYDNSMKITVPKGAVGETMIMAYALNPGESKVNENSVGNPGDEGYTDNLGRIVIRVVDVTPRMITNTFNVDYKSSVGTKLDILEVYADEPNDYIGLIDKDTGLEVVRKKTVNGEVVPDTTDIGIEVYYDPLGVYNDGEPAFYAMRKDGFVMPNDKVITYKDVFLHGYFDKGEKQEFYIPLGKITISNKPFTTQINLSGKINTFYGNRPENNPGTKDDLRGYITVTQTHRSDKIEWVKLVDELHFKNPNSPEDDLFGGNRDADGNLDPTRPGNFIIESDLNDIAKYYIYMNPEFDALKKDKSGKAVVSGYVVFKFVGYETTVSKAITISCGDTKPNYVMSSTKGSMNYYALGQKASFYLYKKGDSKKTPINLDEYVAADSKNIRFNKESTVDNVFLDTISYSKLDDDDDYNSVMTITQDDTYVPQAGKAVIRMHHPSWAENKYIDYTYTLSIVKTKPSAKNYKGNTATVNQAADWASSTIYFYSDQDNVPISNRGEAVAAMYSSIYPTVNKKMMDAAQVFIDGNYIAPAVIKDPDTGRMMLAITVIGCPDPTDVPKGKYTFKMTPIVDYSPYASSGDLAELKEVSFAINVTDKAITLTPKANLVFNKDCASLEEVVTTYALKNMPAGTRQRYYEVDLSGATIENTNKSHLPEYSDVATDLYFEADEDDTKDTCYMSAYLADPKMRKNEPFKYTFKVSGAEVNYDDGELSGTSTLADFKVTIQMREISAKFDLKTTGTINMVDTWDQSSVKVTASFKNFNTEVTDVKLTELDDNMQAKATNEFFHIVRDYRYDDTGAQVINDDKVAYIYLIQPQTDVEKRVVPGKKYKVKLEYTASAFDFGTGNPGNKRFSKNIEITVKQSNPSLTVSYDVNKIYAGQEYRKVNVKIKPSSSVSLGRIIDVQFKNGKDDTYYQAFTIERENGDENKPATTEYQERNGYKYPVFIDYTDTKKPQKMYVETVLADDEEMYELQDGDILYYADETIKKVLKYDSGFFIEGQIVDGAFKPNLKYDKYLILANVKPDVYYTFSMTLDNSSALVLNKEHSVGFVAVLDEQSKDTKGTGFNIKINVLK